MYLHKHPKVLNNVSDQQTFQTLSETVPLWIHSPGTMSHLYQLASRSNIYSGSLFSTLDNTIPTSSQRSQFATSNYNFCHQHAPIDVYFCAQFCWLSVFSHFRSLHQTMSEAPIDPPSSKLGTKAQYVSYKQINASCADPKEIAYQPAGMKFTRLK